MSLPDDTENVIGDDALFKQLISIRNNELNLRWRIVQFFFIINTAALTLIISQMEPEKGISVLQPGAPVHIISCSIGIVLGVLWLKAMKIINGWLEYWIGRLSFFDTKQGAGLFSGEEFVQAEKRFKTGQSLNYLFWVFIFVWTLLFSISLSEALDK